MKTKQYYKQINIIRVAACIAVFLYHLGLLKGGYLAVCIFFTLSGYLAVVSSFRKEEFSLKEYYKNRFIKLYIPLFIVTLISVFIISLFSDIHWISMKNETTSVLLGYNNFWQMKANLDYFARHSDSPFMHFWYISILMQFDLCFPLIFISLKKIGKRINTLLPCILPLLLGILSAIYFYTMCKTNTTNAYYNTFTRLYALFIGVSLGFTHLYYEPYIPKRIKEISIHNIVFPFYFILTIFLYFSIDSTSKYFTISMIGISLITCRLIDYATTNKKKETFFDSIMKFLSKISYEVYLIQYPVIYLFQYTTINTHLKTIFIIGITLLFSYLLHWTLDLKHHKTKKKLILLFLIFSLTISGGVTYICSKSYEEEMQELKDTLAENEKLMEEKQKNYITQEEMAEQDWEKELEKLENSHNYKQMVKELPITFIGDSVMLGAMDNVLNMFPNSYLDAKKSRQIYEGETVLKELKKNHKLGEIVVIHLGTNGNYPNSYKQEILDICENKTVFWINTTNIKKVNTSLNKLKQKNKNLHIIDWCALSKDHSDWFYHDGIHTTPEGQKQYTNIIYDAIYDVYTQSFQLKKEKLIKEHQKELQNRISFYGNESLLYNFDNLQKAFPNSKLVINKNLHESEIKQLLEQAIQYHTLSNRIVFAFDQSADLSSESYKTLIELCKDKQIYIVHFDDTPLQLDSYDHVTSILFYQEIQKNRQYLMADGIHLSKEGNDALLHLLQEIVHK